MNSPIVFFLNSDGVFLLVFGALFLLFINKRDREVFWHALFVFIVTVFTTILLKELFGRPRPYEVTPGLSQNAGLAFLSSFPSAHTAIAFSVSTIVALHRTRLGIFLLIISTLVALGRVAGNVHYPSDIVFGILIGVFVALFFDRVHVRTFSKK